MKIKTNLVKITAAAALTAVGVTGINAVKTSSVQHVQAAVWRIIMQSLVQSTYVVITHLGYYGTVF